MTIELSDDDRARLERLEKGLMEPTRRQKAIALLRLAAGLTSSDAAKHAGIGKEEVEALATGYARGGLAGVGLNGPAEIAVKLLRPGADALEYRLPDGSTLGDLLRRSGATTSGRLVLIDGAPIEDTVPLNHGAVVTIVPRVRNAAGAEPWRATIPAFQDDELFRQYTEALKASRRERISDEFPET